jgi:hypothetical protein
MGAVVVVGEEGDVLGREGFLVMDCMSDVGEAGRGGA